MNDPQPVQAGAELLPGLDHVANFLNALDTEGMTANQVRSAIYSECITPGCKSTDELTRLREKVGHDTVLGDAGDALDYALDHLDDAYERTDFLESWREGDVSDWPAYGKWLAVQYRDRQALADQPS